MYDKYWKTLILINTVGLIALSWAVYYWQKNAGPVIFHLTR